MTTHVIESPDVISMEFMDVGLGKITKALQERLSEYVTKTKLTMLSILKELTVNETEGFVIGSVNKRVSNANYITLSEVAMSVPVGLNCTMLEYMDALGHSQDIVDRIVESTFDTSLNYFSILLASPENLSSLSVNREFARIVLFIKERENAVKEVKKCFLKNDTVEFVKYGALYKRNSDFVTASDQLTDLVERLAKVPSSVIRTKVTAICDILDRLSQLMKRSPDVYTVNGITAKHMSDTTYELAKIAEFYASYFYLIQSITSAAKDNVKRIKDSGI